MTDTTLDAKLQQLQTALMLADHNKTNLNIVKLEARLRGISERQLEDFAIEMTAGTEITDTQRCVASTYLMYKNKDEAPRYFTAINIPMMEQHRAARAERITSKYQAEQQKFLYEYPHLRIRQEENPTLLTKTKAFFNRMLQYA